MAFFTGTVKATHIKAGEISVIPISSVKYRVTLILYYDSLSIKHSMDDNQSLLHASELIDFGDGKGKQAVKLTSSTSIGNNTLKVIYQTDYNYGFRSTNGYLISFYLENRNAYVVNITGQGNAKSSDGIPFYVETFINTGTELGDVYTPILELPPVDNATPNQIFTHNPGARPGVPGDSLSFEMVIPRQSKSQNVNIYTDPNDPQFGGISVNGTPSTFTLNPLTGDIAWDTPAPYFPPGAVNPQGKRYALYNIAILIKEWKKTSRGYKLFSSVIRDMQIEVKEIENHRPELRIPKDTCYVVHPNELLQDTIYVSDPDRKPGKQRIILETKSEVDDFITLDGKPAARLILNNPDSIVFRWKPTCEDVRSNPYNVYFKASDLVAENIRLSNYKTWQIKVLAEKPENFKMAYTGTGFRLSWNQYYCPNAQYIDIYRKDCSSGNFVPDPCRPMSFLSNGFVKVASVSSKDTIYTDTTDIHPGTSYCYVSVANFSDMSTGIPIPTGMSLPSNEICSGAYRENILLTKVSVDNTDSISGKVRVNWKNFVTPLPGATFQYRIFRTEGTIAGNYTQVGTINNITDTTFVDLNPVLNTLDTNFNYLVGLYNNNSLVTISDTASTVFLSLTSKDKTVSLKWDYAVPWNNTKYTHLVYRKKNHEINFTLIDSVKGNNTNATYMDRNVTNRDTFCYYVETRAKYCIDSITGPILNNSEVTCIIPEDSIPPCPPVLSLVDENCNVPVTEKIIKPYKNLVSWYSDLKLECNIDLQGYKLYFAPHPGAEYQFLKSFPADSLSFIHEDFNSQAGCYAVTAFNKRNLESVKSNQECNDNCFYYELPNLVTPNKTDSSNAVFQPYSFPKGVQSVQLYIYNRWGALVHYQEGDVMLNWDPSTKPGLADGIYYYLAKLKLERKLNEKDEKKELKGWIQIIGNQSTSSNGN